MTGLPNWLTVSRGDAPLMVSLPHTGTYIPAEIESRMVSPWLARKDADWWVDRLYDFAQEMGATVVHTGISRAVIDVNRDPSGATLYPGAATTELCPTVSFDGEALYLAGQGPDDAEIQARQTTWFAPYHAALAEEIVRLRARHDRVVLWEAHSIRSHIPRLFEGELPQFNIGTNSGESCDLSLTQAVEAICTASGLATATNGRFKGGWTTRHFGAPDLGVHALQMELACRGYIPEPATAPTPENWPSAYDPVRAEPMRMHLRRMLKACLSFASPSNR